jgi:dihydroorotate dehydrogenase
VLSYRFLRSLLFRLDPERAHHITLSGLKTLNHFPAVLSLLEKRNRVQDPRLEQKCFGIRFGNPVGMAAGLDKNAEVIPAMAALGFGFLECGTVTPLPQTGNPRPRLFRHVEHQSLQNELGFNNQGMDSMWSRLIDLESGLPPVGINIGKNKTTPPEKTADDYVQLVRRMKDRAAYFTINISSPNTPGLRDFQRPDFIRPLLGQIRSLTSRPVLLKLSPDMDPDDLLLLSETAITSGVDGIVINNTSTDYALCPGARPSGGLSGKCIRERSHERLRLLAEHFHGKTVLISVGGIDSAGEALKRIRAGANLVQVYTGLVFKGPGLVSRINRGLLEIMSRDQIRNITEVVGSGLS